MGATLGQGFHFGRPAPIPTGTPAAGPPVRFLGSGPAAEGPTPFGLVSARRALRRGDLQLVRALAEHVAGQARSVGSACVVLASVGARTADVPSAGALADLLAPHFAALISACSLGRGGDAYEFAVSYERTLVVGCARALVSRLRPLD